MLDDDGRRPHVPHRAWLRGAYPMLPVLASVAVAGAPCVFLWLRAQTQDTTQIGGGTPGQ